MMKFKYYKTTKPKTFFFMITLACVPLLIFETADEAFAQNTSNNRSVLEAYSNREKTRDVISLVPVRASHSGQGDNKSLQGLAEGLKKWTEINVTIDKTINLDSPLLLKYPFVYLNTENYFELLESEKNNFQKYLSSEGFIIIEFNIRSYPGLKQYLPGNARLKPVPNDHPIYQSFFAIEDNIWDQYVAGERREKLSAELSFGPYIMGIWIGNRLAGVYSDKEMGNEWERYWESGSREGSKLRVGVNMVVYALGQAKATGMQ
ncbi:MAG: DUF4159 domain-containing protein [Candidatus Latescibacteria bacterium]|nr:DUF4159 domain-containing protein [Candidatus Latescibacterota bacterium]